MFLVLFVCDLYRIVRIGVLFVVLVLVMVFVDCGNVWLDVVKLVR